LARTEARILRRSSVTAACQAALTVTPSSKACSPSALAPEGHKQDEIARLMFDDPR
jgi:hypothetical protein